MIEGTSRTVRIGLALLRWFCPTRLYESVEGDLLEQLDDESKVAGKKKAGRKFIWNVIKFLRPGIILRNRFSKKFNSSDMLSNYFTITFRSLKKNLAYSLINILGLAIGIASCLLIYNYVQFEKSFDETHPDVERLYRVNQTAIWSPSGGIMTSSGPQLAHSLQNDYPEVEQVTRINTPGDYIVRYLDNEGKVIAVRENGILAADSNFFSFFDFKLKEGDARTALVGKNKVVLSSEVAEKYFGDEPAVGKILQFGETRESVEVAGVTEKQPLNVHFHFDYLISMPTNESVKDLSGALFGLR